MKLAGILGQDRALAVLRESIARRRLHHALLFSGPEGVGKFTTAKALAARLLCESGGEDACGSCDGCAQVEAETHPDLHVVRFEVDERGRARKLVGIDQVRAVQSVLVRSALAGRHRIAIVDEAQALSLPAQNAFLKTLEEPPAGALVILVARNASALLPTVRSRCQRIPFAPLPDDTVVRILCEGHNVSAQDARRIAVWAEGSPGLAVSIDAAGLADAEQRLESILDGWNGRSHTEVIRAVDVLAGQPDPLGLPLLLRVLRRRLRLAAGLDGESELTPPAKTVSLFSVLRAAEHAYRASVDLNRHANPQIALERMWLGIGESLLD